MTIVAQFSWDDIADMDFGNPARRAWREAVAEVTAKAQAALPECNGRVEKAAQIVLNGDVELLLDGKAKVASQSNGQTTYHIANGTCDCADFPRAPQGQCKHKIATHLEAIDREAAELRTMLSALRSQQDLAHAFEAHLTEATTLLTALQERLEEVERTDDVKVKRQVIELLVAGLHVDTEDTPRGKHAVVTVTYTFTPKRVAETRTADRLLPRHRKSAGCPGWSTAKACSTDTSWSL